MAENEGGTDVTEEQKRVVQTYDNLKRELLELYSKIAEIDADKSEHELVLTQLNGLNGSRKCWQQVGEVLVESNVETVVPVLEEKKKHIEEAIQTLQKQVQLKENELGELQKRYKIQVKPQVGVN
uniref:Prefoldin subunit 2 n=1 Tax=Rhodosorus marinus TaxID=101924 RepID=A0A6T6NX25_9RHOD